MRHTARRRRLALGSLILVSVLAGGLAHATSAHAAPLPVAVDLSIYAPPVADQGGPYVPPLSAPGNVYPDAAWALGYYLRGWYARRDGYFPWGTGSASSAQAGYAPMYLFSQTAPTLTPLIGLGTPSGFSLQPTLDLLQSQGIDSRSDYTQGDHDGADLPSPAERANAATAKIAGYDLAFYLDQSLQTYIETKLAGGDPVVLGIVDCPAFDQADATHAYIRVPSGQKCAADIAVTAFKYDANGVWVENSRGPGWGQGGWAELSWDYITYQGVEAASIVPLSPLVRFYSTTTATHWVTTNLFTVSSGYHTESMLGLLLARPQFGAAPLFDCLAAPGSADHFVALLSSCEGHTLLGLEGYVYSSLQPGTVPIYRCRRTINRHGDHFVSLDPHCEGYTTDTALGYVQM